jgi:hypothetical protein
MKFTVQGKILSEVICYIEREKQAAKRNIPLESVPLKYGAIRLAVNLIELENKVHVINKSSKDASIKQERLILEISYKFDKDGKVISDHEIIEELHKGQDVELTLDQGYIAKNHHLKLINTAPNSIVKSYFVKCWADKISFLNVPEMTPENSTITPKEVVTKMSLNPNLIIA